MKNSKSFLFPATVALMLLFSNSLFGAIITSFDVEPLQHEMKFLLTIQTEGLGDINIQIMDKRQNVIFSEKTNSGRSYEKQFSLEGLKKGDYFLEIEDEFKITSQSLIIKEQALEVDKKSRQTRYKPQLSINQKERHFDINWMMNHLNKFQLTIEDDNANIIFQNKIKNRRVIHERYDISKLKKGTYYLTIKNNEQTYYRTIQLEE